MNLVDLAKTSVQSELIEYQKHSSDWTPKSNVDCSWNVMLIPENINTKPHFDPSIIYFNKKYINSEITIVSTSISIYQVFEPYKSYSIFVQEQLMPILRTYDIRKNWKQLGECEQEAIMKTANEWLLEQLNNKKKRFSDDKVILFFYGILEKRVELNGFVKNNIEYISRSIIKVFKKI